VPAGRYGDRSTLTSACGELQTMSHIIDSSLLTKLAGGLSKLQSADDDAVAWLTTNYGGPWRMHMTSKTTSQHPCQIRVHVDGIFTHSCSMAIIQVNPC